MQTALNALAKWAAEWSLTISKDRLSRSFSSPTRRKTTGGSIRIFGLGGYKLKVEVTPTFLGVTFDASLTFVKHARGIKQQVTKRVGLLRRLRGKEWGCSMGLLR
jgi:hypothetical protein